MSRLHFFLLAAVLGTAAACDDASMTEPVAVFEARTHAIAGQVVTFDARASSGEAPLQYAWHIDDAVQPVAHEPVAALRFAIAGDYRVTLVVRDRHGNAARNTSSITIAGDFVPPLAKAGADVDVEVGEPVSFDASGSVDNVAITRWAWDFDASDGPWFDHHDPVVEHAYADAGLYRATLTVWDGAGNETTDERIVRVRPAADLERPTADLGPDRRVHVGANTIIDASRSRDNVGIVEFRFSSETADLEPIDGQPSAVRARFDTAGRAVVRLEVTDAAGNVAHDELVIDAIVDTTPPTARIDSDVVVEARRPVMFDARSSDDNTEIVAWIWDGESTTSPTLTRSFAEPGLHSVSLEVVDAAGLRDSTTREIEVGQAVPVAIVARDDVLRPAPGEFVAPLVELEFADLSRVETVPHLVADGTLEIHGTMMGASAPTLATVVVEAAGRESRLDVAVGPSVIGVDQNGLAWPIFGDGATGASLALGGRAQAWDRSGNTIVFAVEAGRRTRLVAVELPMLRLVTIGDLAVAVDEIVAIGVNEVVALAGDRVLSTSGLDMSLDEIVPPSLRASRLGAPIGEIVPVVLEPRNSEDVTTAATILLLDRLTARVIDATPESPTVDGVALAPSCRGRVELLDARNALVAVCMGDDARAAVVQQIATSSWQAARPVALDGNAHAAAADTREQEIFVIGARRVWRIDLSGSSVEQHDAWTGADAVLLDAPQACVRLDERLQCIDGSLQRLRVAGASVLIDARWYRPGGWLEAHDQLTAVESAEPFGTAGAIRGAPAGLGPMGANAEPDGVYTIGNHETLTISLVGRALVDGPGHDLVVFENAFYRAGRYFSRWIEPASVEVSFDGVQWVLLSGPIDASRYGVDGADPRAFSGYAGVGAVLSVAGLFDETGGAAGGDRFDLAGSGLPEVRHVRLRDVGDDGYTPDIDAVGLRNFAWR